ncbi:MAG: PaaI family thioesterase [Candidatus Zixiibacteriota bacterium]
MQEIIRNNVCFVCGDGNRDGLHIRFFVDGDQAVAAYTPEAKYQGFQGILHGGLTATLLDEIMAKAVLSRQRWAMTVEMNVRYKKAIPIGESLRLVGRVTREVGRLLETAAEIVGPDGQVYASATGKYLEAAAKVGKLG